MPSFWLEYDNNGQIQEFNFDGDSVSIGRDKSSEFVLDHPTVSRQHAVITRKNGGFYLVVLSRGGMTAIDGQQIQGEVMLHDGSMIYLGQLQFRFRSNQAPPKPAGGQQQMGQNQFGGMQGDVQGGYNPANQNQASHNQGGPAGGFAQSVASSFGNQGAQQGQSGGGFGFGDSPSSGSASNGSFGAGGVGPSPGEQASGQQSAGQQAGGEPSGEGGADSGIISWDEIASSTEATGEGGAEKQATVHERMNAKKDEDTNPVLVIVAGVGIVGLLWWTFFSGGPKTTGPSEEDKPLSEQAPVTLEISCMGESACVQKAKDAYKVGVEKLDKKGAATTNLFEGYKKLLETEKYLEKAGKTEPLPEMAGLESKKKQAREELTALFKNERVKYHQAKKRNLHRPMAQALDAVKIYFPDKTAREHRWALSEEMDMKKKGIYPKYVYPPN